MYESRVGEALRGGLSGCCGDPVLVGDVAKYCAATYTVFGEVDRCGWSELGLLGR
jgi:hypothetical protein